MLSPHAKSEWTTLFVIGLLLSASAVLAGWWWLSIPLMISTLGLMLFFRDPDRPIPTQRGIMVAPADGKISSIHPVEFFEPFNGPATCIRIFLSVFDVHINRSPIHGVITSITHKPGEHLNVLNPQSAEVNEYNLLVFAHPIRRDAVAAVRQVAGLCARTICCTVNTGSVIQRGQRIGLIKLGSTTELYIPARFNPQVLVEQGQYVYGGTTILANVNMGPAHEGEEDQDETQPQQPLVEEHTDTTPQTVTQRDQVTDDTDSNDQTDQVDLEGEQLEEDDQATDVVEAIDAEPSDTDSEDHDLEIVSDETDQEPQEEVDEDELPDDQTEVQVDEDELTDSQDDALDEDDATDQIEKDESEAEESSAESPSKQKSDDETPMLF